jgi:preprotein translocase subunit SecA
MQESRLDSLKDKVDSLGADTIMGAMKNVGEDYRDKVEKLQEAVAKVKEDVEAETSTSDRKEFDEEAIKKAALAGYFRRTRPVVRDNKKIGRNDPCPCGSGEKYKNCCMDSGKYETTHYA